MRVPREHEPVRVIRTAVLVTMAYAGIHAVWLICMSALVRWPTPFDPEPYRLISTEVYRAFSGAHGLLAIWLVAGTAAAWRGPLSVKWGQLAGIGLSLILLATLQFGAGVLHRPLEHESGLGPHKLETFLSRLEAPERALVGCVREAFFRAAPRITEAVCGDELGYAGRGTAGKRFGQGSIQAQPGSVRVLYPEYWLCPPGLALPDGPWRLHGTPGRPGFSIVIQSEEGAARLAEVGALMDLVFAAIGDGP